MKYYKKSLLGSIFMFFIGTSCCWLSSLMIWLGGSVVIGAIYGLVQDFHILFIVLGFGLLIIAIFSYFKSKR